MKRNYKNVTKYPFNCDFYIPELDLYIECNFHWTHGHKPFDKDDEYCKKQLFNWKFKAENSQFYKNAINTWTVRDVNKRKIAQENKLNYIEFWNLNEIKTWLEMIK